MDIQIVICCDGCSKELVVKNVGVRSDGRIIVHIDPCKRCLERERKEDAEY